ncbi:hypothetical protein, partial [Escherichia coli]|uniref:hypothetical protein n=1 Tax=Escherichia coli TaxID=562 RepID=UPI001CF95496
TGGTADRNRSHWSTSKTPSYTKSVSWQHHPVYLYKSQTSYPKYIWGYIGLSMSGCDRDQRYAGIIFVNGL